MGHVVPAILGRSWPRLVGLEEHLSNVFVRAADELQQGLVLGRIILPQMASPALARKDPAEEDDLDHVDKLDFLAYHSFNTVLESGQLHR